MTVSAMSMYPSPHASMAVRPPHSILSATLSARSPQSLLSSSKGKLGFSIDSIVGDKSESSRDNSSSPVRAHSPISRCRSPRDRSPIYRVRSPSPNEDYKRSPSPPHGIYSRSESPPSPSLVRPIPTSIHGNSPSLVNTQSYLDQLASLKAFYEARGNPQLPPSSGASTLLPPTLGIPGLHPMLSALPRHPSNLPGGLPHFLGLHGQHPGLPSQQIPREYPLYPWFINRHRFPGGPHLPEFLLPFRKPKRVRTAFSPSQLLKLEQAFEKNQYVVGQERKELAKSLHLSETQVKVWFQNRRTKHKREETETEQQQGLNKMGHGVGGGGQSSEHHLDTEHTILEESGDEDIDCE